MEPNLRVLAEVVPAGIASTRRFSLDLSESHFVHAVESACWLLQSFVDPESSMYEKPVKHFTEFDDSTREQQDFIRRNRIGGDRDFTDNHMSVLAWQGIELIHKYAAFRSADPRSWLVGESWATRIIVYRTLALAQQWKVLNLLESERVNGPEFGSATGWNRTDVFEPVRLWHTPGNMPELSSHVMNVPYTPWQLRDRAQRAEWERENERRVNTDQTGA